METVLARRVPEMDLRLCQCAGRHAGDRQERRRRDRRPARCEKTAGRYPQQGARHSRHHGRGEPAQRKRQGLAGNRGGAVPQSHQLQGRISFPQRQHQTGTKGGGA